MKEKVQTKVINIDGEYKGIVFLPDVKKYYTIFPILFPIIKPTPSHLKEADSMEDAERKERKGSVEE